MNKKRWGLVDEFLLHGIIADRYVTQKEAKLLKNIPIDFSSPWWIEPEILSMHFDYLIQEYGGGVG